MTKQNPMLVEAAAHYDHVVNIRRDIHQHPELGFDVGRTAGIAAQELKRLGIKVKEGVGKTGVVGDIDVPGATKRIALRADMDALPIQEENNVSYKSKNAGKAHMCGHDAHTAMLIGAARIIKANEKDLKVNVRFIFQPSEEVHPGGAPEMIKDGALDGVDQIYGLHVYPLIETGTVAVGSGPFFGSSDRFEINISGKGGHAAFPHLADDVIVMGSQFVNAIQSVVARELNPTDPGIVSVTMFNAGTAPNVLPSNVVIKGSVRTLTEENRTYVEQRLKDVLEGIVTTSKASYKFSYHRGYPPVLNQETLAQHVAASAQQLVGEERLVFPHPSVLAGEDFGYYSQAIPACFFLLGAGNKEKGIKHMLLHPSFDIDEMCMLYGMAMHAGIVLRGA